MSTSYNIATLNVWSEETSSTYLQMFKLYHCIRCDNDNSVLALIIIIIARHFLWTFCFLDTNCRGFKILGSFIAPVSQFSQSMYQSVYFELILYVLLQSMVSSQHETADNIDSHWSQGLSLHAD